MATSSSAGPWRRRSRPHSAGTRADVWDSGNVACPFCPRRPSRCRARGSKLCSARPWNAWPRSAPRTGRRCSDSRKRGTAEPSGRRCCSPIAATADHPARRSDSGRTSCHSSLARACGPPSRRCSGRAARTLSMGCGSAGSVRSAGRRPALPTSPKMAGGASPATPAGARGPSRASVARSAAMTAPRISRGSRRRRGKRGIRSPSARRAGRT
jgi:hypothetical protein